VAVLILPIKPPEVLVAVELVVIKVQPQVQEQLI
jgi:hypothetical protein